MQTQAIVEAITRRTKTLDFSRDAFDAVCQDKEKRLGKNLLPEDIRAAYQIEERHHACSILKTDFPEEWKNLVDVLREFKLRRSDIAKPGGRKSPISESIDELFFNRGWVEKKFEIKVTADGTDPWLRLITLITRRTAWLSARPRVQERKQEWA